MMSRSTCLVHGGQWAEEGGREAFPPWLALPGCAHQFSSVCPRAARRSVLPCCSAVALGLR